MRDSLPEARPQIRPIRHWLATAASPTGERVRLWANRLLGGPARAGFLRDWAIDLSIGTGCAVFLGLIGPFGSYLNGPAWQRVAFQLGCFWPGMLLYGTMVRLVLRLGLSPARMWAVLITATAILNAPFQVFVSALGIAVWPFLRHLRPFDWYIQGLLVTEPVVIGFVLLAQARLRQRQRASEAGLAPANSFGLLGTSPEQVLCLQMEGHYVRVHTAGGSRLVLTTMGQAVAAVGTVEGLQVHRSWWVARKAVLGTVADGRNLRLQLAHGVSAPVARSAVASVRAAGWIASVG